MKSLTLYDYRKPVYFGVGVPEKHLPKWINDCNAMKISRQERDLVRLRVLEHIYIRVEIGRKFKDWCNYVACRRLLNKHRLLRMFATWRRAFMIKIYSVLEALIDNKKMFLRKRFQTWHETTIFLRAIYYYNMRLERKYFREWVIFWQHGKTSKVGKYFKAWKDWLRLIKTLNKLGALGKGYPYSAFQHWKTLTFRQVDLSSVLEAIRLRTMREVLMYLYNTADALIDKRLLEGLPTRGSIVSEAAQTPPPPSPKHRKSTRKAPLDTRRPSCACVLNVCKGGRCECTFETHFSRRLALCFDEVDQAKQDKEVAREIVRQSTVSHSARTSISRSREGKLSVTSTPVRKDHALRAPKRAFDSPQVLTKSARPPPIPSTKQRTRPPVFVSAGINRDVFKSHQSSQHRSIESYLTPQASVNFDEFTDSNGVLEGSKDVESGPKYSLDDEIAGEVIRDFKIRPSRIDILTMPAAAATGSARQAHDVVSSASPNRIKRSVSKKIRGVSAPEPMSHWNFKNQPLKQHSELK